MKHSFILNPDTSVEEVVKALDEGGVGFLAFVDHEKKLMGVITDGDLRRGILNKDLSVQSVINHDPVYMDVTESKDAIVSKLKQIHRRHMPLVNGDNRLVSVFSLDDIEFISQKNVVVIMAGGLGSRLGELTKETPKPMLVVGDRPMLQHLVEQFRDQGFNRFIFCLNYKKEIIQNHFGDGQQYGVKINYVTEETRLGTAGALSLLEKNINDPFFVINADVLTNLDFNAFLEHHNQNRSIASMCVREYEQQVPYGVVCTDNDGNITEIKEKPNYSFDVNAGIYVLNPQVLEHVPSNIFYDMPQLFEKLISLKHKCSRFSLVDYWMDIGRVQDLKKANEDVLQYEIK
jgi:dTDP-glucose pyrophosphorylase